jgi:cell division protein FtsL
VLRILNIVLVLMVLAAAFTLYSLEHETRRGERRIAELKRGISDEQEMIRLLEAEWSNLTRPHRIEQLASQHLDLVPLSPLQLVGERDLGSRLPLRPASGGDTEPGKDPIADMLKVLK